MLEQGRQPFRNFHVRRAPRHVLDRLGIDQKNLEVFFQDMVDRLPEDPGAFHRNSRQAPSASHSASSCSQGQTIKILVIIYLNSHI
jgi:hypothetical protein